MLKKMQVEDNFLAEIRNPSNFDTVRDAKYDQCIDLTEDSLQEFSKTCLKNTAAKCSLNGCFYKNDNVFDNMGTISSVTSWTSSSDDILCTNNSQVFCIINIYIFGVFTIKLLKISIYICTHM